MAGYMEGQLPPYTEEDPTQTIPAPAYYAPTYPEQGHVNSQQAQQNMEQGSGNPQHTLVDIGERHIELPRSVNEPGTSQQLGDPETGQTVPRGAAILRSHGIQPEYGFINPRHQTTDEFQVYAQNEARPNGAAINPNLPRYQGRPIRPDDTPITPANSQHRCIHPHGDIRPPPLTGQAHTARGESLPNPEVVPTDVTLVRRTVIIIGQVCPRCRNGILQEELNKCLICLAILFFPIGLLFLICAKQKVCNNCRALF